MKNNFLQSKSWLIPVCIIGAALLVVALMTLARGEPEKTAETGKVMAITALEIQKQDVTITIPSQGRVTPRVKTLLTSEVSGSVTEVSDRFVKGGFVRKGEELLKLDDRNYQAAARKAEANVAKFQKALIQEKGQAQVAYNQWKNNRGATKSEEARSLLLRKPQLREAKANLAFAKAELERVEGDLQKTTIVAPFDGLIKEKYINIAQYATAGTQLAELVAIDYAEVRLAIPQEKLAYLDLPDIPQTDHRSIPEAARVSVVLSARYGEKTYQWDADIVRTEGLFDDQNQSLYAVARVDDPYGLKTGDNERSSDRSALLMGTYVKAAIQGRRMQDVVQIPRDTLRAGNYVWIIDDNNQLRNRKVSTLKVGGHKVYVTDGLNDGDRVCLTNVGEVIPGTPVKIASLDITNSQRTAMLDD